MSANPQPEQDPRIYMAAERTFLAWIRTGIALMGFGFVIARFGLFLRELNYTSEVPVSVRGPAYSMQIGIGLIAVGIIVNIVSVLRHRRYIEAIDSNQFRGAFGSVFAIWIAGLLAVVGIVMTVVLMRL